MATPNHRQHWQSGSYSNQSLDRETHQLSQVNLNRTVFDLCNGNPMFTESSLYESVFKRCAFKGAVFTSACLTDASFQSSSFHSSIFTGCYAHGLNFRNITLKSCLFDNVNISRLLIEEDSEFYRVSFARSHLLDIEARYCHFHECDFTFTDLKKSVFNGSVFKNCIFRNANLTEVSFDGCQLENCDFTDAYGLDTATFKNAKVVNCHGIIIEPVTDILMSVKLGAISDMFVEWLILEEAKSPLAPGSDACVIEYHLHTVKTRSRPSEGRWFENDIDLTRKMKDLKMALALVAREVSKS